MALTMETSETTEATSQFIDKPGVYHLAVVGTEEAPTTKDGKFIDAFEITVAVAAGPQENREARLLFNNPNATHKDQGNFARTMQTRILEVLGLIRPEAKGKQVTVELSDAMGRQFIGKFRAEEYNGKQQIRLDGLNFWHVDDPNAEKCERNQQAINLLPKDLRRSPDTFPKKEDKGATTGAKPAAGGKAKPPVDTDDL